MKLALRIMAIVLTFAACVAAGLAYPFITRWHDLETAIWQRKHFVWGLLLVPIVLFTSTLLQDWLRPHLEPQEWDRFWREIVPQRQPKLASWLRQMGWEAPPLTQGLARASEMANHYVQVVLTGVATVALDLTIVLMMLCSRSPRACRSSPTATLSTLSIT